jgi:anti-sigma regulatory factor (Ser/Thr protein kinase)
LDRPLKRRAGGLFLEAQHQLRQPLNALGLLIGELRQARGDREIGDIAEDMRYALLLTTNWLNALAELDQLEQGLLDLRVQDVAVQPLFDQLQADFAPRFAEHGLDFRVVPTRAAVRADPAMLRRLLVALLENAVKFTREGRVLLGCRRDGGDCRIEVWDSGLGVAEAELERLFDPFFRLENEVRPRERGLGLGLAYARALAELAGDLLTVRSRLGAGSCFAVTLRPAGGESAEAESAYSDGVPSAVLDHLTNPLGGAEVVVLAGKAVDEVRPLLETWGARPRVVAAEDLIAVRAAGARLVIADAGNFAAAGGWNAPGGPADAVVLIADQPLQSTGHLAGAVHFLRRPLKPARLRALCHFALAPPAE